jgi:N-acylneuraminate cytidylyltransferase
MRIAIIPARGGSKRIKNKNIADFLGKPLISYALEAVKESCLFDVIHVSTDSEEIRTVVEELGYKVDFMRSKELADDHIGLMPVLKWVVEKYRGMGILFDDICCIMPAAPLLATSDLIDGFNLYDKNNRANPLLVVAPFPVPIEWAFYRDENTHLIPKDVNSLTTRSQDIKPAFYEAGPFSIHHYSHIQDEDILKNLSYLSLLINKSRAVDIDDPDDLELAKILYLGRKALKDYKDVPKVNL